MNVSTQSVEQTVSEMAKVLADYLSPEEVNHLIVQWQNYPSVSVKMMQQCVLEATIRYPKLREYKSDIRKGFWYTMQTSSQLPVRTADNEYTTIGQKSVSEDVQAFHTVIEALVNQLSALDSRSLFHTMHQTILQERTFEGHDIDIEQFLEDVHPTLPDDSHILNNLVQLAYVCLCDIVGAVEADDILFKAAEVAKQKHPRSVVEKLF